MDGIIEERRSDQRSGRRRVVTTRRELLPPSAFVVLLPLHPPSVISRALIPPIRGQKGDGRSRPAARQSVADFSSPTSLLRRRLPFGTSRNYPITFR